MKIVISQDRPLKIGAVIATHAAPAYVELGLSCLKRHEPNVAVLVHDDSSADIDKLRKIAQNYDADFVSTESRRAPTVGDLSAFSEGLRWADARGLDIVVKVSRRFIIDRPWSLDLATIFQNMQYPTVTGACRTFFFGLRSEIQAMHVRSWVDSGAMAEMAGIVNANRHYASLPEAEIHNWVRKVYKYVHPENPEASFWSDSNHPECDFVVRGETRFKRPATCDCFFEWPLIGLARSVKVPGILWHDSHTSADYWALSKNYGLTYSLEDFTIIPGQ